MDAPTGEAHLACHANSTVIDGAYRAVLAVRDLASGRQLLWLPVEDPVAWEVVSALASLFAVHGAPLVRPNQWDFFFALRPLDRRTNSMPPPVAGVVSVTSSRRRFFLRDDAL